MITLYVQLAGETERETERPLLNKPARLLCMTDTARSHERVRIRTIRTVVLYVVSANSHDNAVYEKRVGASNRC